MSSDIKGLVGSPAEAGTPSRADPATPSFEERPDHLTARLRAVAYGTTFLDVREDILALIERDNSNRLDSIAVAELLAAARAQRDGLLNAAKVACDAIKEFHRYQYGGDGRYGGSYDGRPEREGLWFALSFAQDAIALAEPKGVATKPAATREAPSVSEERDQTIIVRPKVKP